MNRNYSVIITAAAIALVGCSTPTTGVVRSVGGDALTVTHQGSSALASTAELRVNATKEAEEHCLAQGKPIRVIHVKETPARVFGGWPEAEIVFTCG